MMYVRYMGNKACWTVLDSTERFYIGDRDELTAQEREVCEHGGGELDLSFEVNVVAR